MPVFLDRITSRPLGSVYLVAVTRGTADGAAGRAAVGVGAFWAMSVLRPAVERRTARTRASRVCIVFSDGPAARGPSYAPTEPALFQAGPQVPTGDRSIRTPLLSKFRQPLRRRNFPHAVRPLDGLDDAEVADREHVRPVQSEHQEHLRGPASDPFDTGQCGDDSVVGHVIERIERQFTARDASLEIPEVRNLLTAQADDPQRVVINTGQAVRS